MSEKKTSIGGQALIEGIMMRGPVTSAMAVRLPGGDIDTETWPTNKTEALPWYKKTCFIRGIFNMVDTLGTGFSCLMKSAEKAGMEEEEPTKFEKWRAKVLGASAANVMNALAVVLGVGLALLLATMRFGVMAMAYSLLVSSVFSQMINAWPNRKLLDYGYREQLRDILPSILLALFMGLAVWGVSLLPLPPLLVLAVQVVFGAEVYLTGSALFGLDAFVYLWRRLKAAAGGQAGGKGNEKT